MGRDGADTFGRTESNYLRHALATMLFAAGASANDVQAMLGHSSMQMTERYSRARSDVARRAEAAIDSLFGSG